MSNLTKKDADDALWALGQMHDRVGNNRPVVERFIRQVREGLPGEPEQPTKEQRDKDVQDAARRGFTGT